MPRSECVVAVAELEVALGHWLLVLVLCGWLGHRIVRGERSVVSWRSVECGTGLTLVSG